LKPASKPKLFTPSLLHRFEVDDPKARGNGAPLYQSRDDWRDSLIEDILDLLNSKFDGSYLSERYPSLSNSIRCYGLPDFSNMSVRETRFASTVKDSISRALTLFESRLIEIEVHESEGGSATNDSFAFQISGRIRSDPDEPRMSFRTALDLASKTFIDNRGKSERQS
jgi:type VI secretion system lysozyme-like protein